MPTDLERAYAALAAKQTLYTTLFAYHAGDHPVVYTAHRLSEIFQGIDAKFNANWAEVVVGVLCDRVTLRGFNAPTAAADQTLDGLWRDLSLNLEAEDAHEALSITGESYLVVWQDEADGVQAYYNDPRLAHVFYQTDNPRVKRFAAKWWDDDDGRRRLTLYYPDHLEYYVSRGSAGAVTSAGAFVPYTDAGDAVVDNPYGVIPVFHFRTGRRPRSDLANVLPLQNGINKLLIDMMVNAEYGAFPQRYIISQMDIAGRLKNAPNEVWLLQGGESGSQPTSVGQFQPAQLANYLDAIDRLMIYVASIMRIPKHYLLQQGGDPSGEALIAMEAPLNKRAAKRIERLRPVWQEAGAFLLQLATGAAVKPSDVSADFETPESVLPLTRAQIGYTRAQTYQILTDGGWPLEFAAQEIMGLDQDQLDRLTKAVEQEPVDTPPPPLEAATRPPLVGTASTTPGEANATPSASA